VTEQPTDRDPVYERLAATEEFHELRSAYRRFIVPATVAFVVWYGLYVCLSMFAGDFMNTRLVGHVNVALVLGLLQFLTTFGIAWAYSRYSNARLDPLARELTATFEAERRRPTHGTEA